MDMYKTRMAVRSKISQPFLFLLIQRFVLRMLALEFRNDLLHDADDFHVIVSEAGLMQAVFVVTDLIEHS